MVDVVIPSDGKSSQEETSKLPLIVGTVVALFTAVLLWPRTLHVVVKPSSVANKLHWDESWDLKLAGIATVEIKSDFWFDIAPKSITLKPELKDSGISFGEGRATKYNWGTYDFKGKNIAGVSVDASAENKGADEFVIRSSGSSKFPIQYAGEVMSNPLKCALTVLYTKQTLKECAATASKNIDTMNYLDSRCKNDKGISNLGSMQVDYHVWVDMGWPWGQNAEPYVTKQITVSCTDAVLGTKKKGGGSGALRAGDARWSFACAAVAALLSAMALR